MRIYRKTNAAITTPMIKNMHAPIVPPATIDTAIGECMGVSSITSFIMSKYVGFLNEKRV